LREENERKTEALRVAADTAERASDAAAERETGLAAELSERTAELASVQSALDESHAEAGAERQRRTEAEERLIEASGDLHQQQLRNAELVGQVAASQSALVQRQEELAQLLNQFREADRVRVRAEAECEQERVRRIQSEQQMASAEAKIGALQAQLHEARRLSEEITQLREAVSATQVARSASERKLADRFNELTQLTAIVSEEAGRADKAKSDADWLRAMCKLEEGFPTWWAILPQTWRQRRVHRRYRNAGLFDAEAYLQLYPDVNAEAMDPVRHYILHGMVEGRTRTSPS
jgi:chromosome segregation ATPase